MSLKKKKMENEKYQVKVERNLLIPLRDGATLAPISIVPTRRRVPRL